MKANRESDESAALLDWYDVHRRALPWRASAGQTPDPYHVWLSEIMLQQTTVAAVIPYFKKFLKFWPDVTALAAARDQEILSAWAGLGYYARARNLIACAKILATNGFPEDEAALLALPGVGAYTAAAVAAIAFEKRAVVIDANIARVVARLRAIATLPPQAKKPIHAAMDAITPHVRVGDFAQAMMDLGASICTPKKPDCAICPLKPFCWAARKNAPEAFPKRAPRTPRPEKFGHVFVARRADGAYLLRTRPQHGLLGAMAEFFGGRWEQDKPAPAPPFSADWARAGQVRHIFTHFALTLEVWTSEVNVRKKAPKNCRWSHSALLKDEPLPGLMRKVELCANLVLDAMQGARDKKTISNKIFEES